MRLPLAVWVALARANAVQHAHTDDQGELAALPDAPN
jgi:hypothetical protein